MPARNPFIPGKPANDLGAFWGRQRELRLLSSYLLDSEQPQSSALIGSAYIGKTSLLCHLLAWHHASAAERSNWPSLHTDHLARTVEVILPMSELTTAHADRFYQRLISEMRKQLANLAAQGQPAISLPKQSGTADPISPLERFHDMLDIACAAGYRFHFLLDDFAAITENPAAFDDIFFTQLRSCAQSYNVAWVLAIDRPIPDLWEAPDMAQAPFFGSLRQVTLGLLRDD